LSHDARLHMIWNSTPCCKVDVVCRDKTGTQGFCCIPDVGRPHTYTEIKQTIRCTDKQVDYCSICILQTEVTQDGNKIKKIKFLKIKIILEDYYRDNRRRRRRRRRLALFNSVQDSQTDGLTDLQSSRGSDTQKEKKRVCQVALTELLPSVNLEATSQPWGPPPC
jgi:hypothetical protein